MPTTRRDFLKAGAIAAAGLPLLPSLGHAVPVSRFVRPGEAAPSPAPTGLFFDESDLPRMRLALEHPHVAPYWKSINGADLAGDLNFIRKEAKFNDHAKDLLRVRQILERTSFIYALTGDAAQRDAAKIAVDKILAYPKWDYFLEGGEDVIGLQRAPEVTIAMSCATQWLAGAISKETVAEMEKQIGEKGAPACYRTLYGMKYPDRVRGWGFDPEDDLPVPRRHAPVAPHSEFDEPEGHPDRRSRDRRVPSEREASAGGALDRHGRGEREARFR